MSSVERILKIAWITLVKSILVKMAASANFSEKVTNVYVPTDLWVNIARQKVIKHGFLFIVFR